MNSSNIFISNKGFIFFLLLRSRHEFLQVRPWLWQTILFLTLSVSVTLGALIHNSNSGPRSTPSTANTGVAASIRTVCNVTRFPASCYSSISSLTTSLQNPNDPESILKLSPRISAAMTDQETCLDGLEETEPAALGEMKGKMQRSREYTSNRKIQSR
ncbi:hypothetical protein K1719_000168 [Acacia pycnantha]|nr:hypothetical protein K1719_000168 [Acacia pycnantha]